MKKFNVLLLVLPVWVLGNCLLAPTDAVASWNVSKDSSLYGNLNQNHIPNWGSYACGPTSVVNSFVYLERKYGYAYDRKLVPDTDNGNDYDESEMISVANILGGNGYMHTITYNTTYADYLAYGKKKYMDEKAPGVTNYNAQSYWGWTAPGPKPDWYVTNTKPTKNFLYDELSECADVEILLQGGAAHYLTVYSFNWMDADNDGIIDKSESTIGIVDPWGGILGSYNLWEQGGFMHINYATDSWIGAVITEIPEPATIALLGLGGLAMLRRRRQGN